MPKYNPITEYDMYLFGQGAHYEMYEKLGAHPCKKGKKAAARSGCLRKREST